ncbi:MAG: GNAT family N-acetyltransferase [Dehalococcoidia bacterium]|nr:MAG: GNAT family N-acetyltransferase [Dehalococcoidia bacterium]
MHDVGWFDLGNFDPVINNDVNVECLKAINDEEIGVLETLREIGLNALHLTVLVRAHHYRSKSHEESEGLWARDCFKLLFEGELIGVIVYSRSYLNLKPRNIVFGKRYVFTPGDIHKANLINEEIARISRVVIHPKFRSIGLGSYLVKETMLKVNAKVIEALAVMAKYNPFFEKAGMVRVDYSIDRSSKEKEVRGFLETHNFDFNFVKSKIYCTKFFVRLSNADKKRLIEYLTDFARQPFIKAKKVTPDLLTKMFSTEATYRYWMNL